MKKNILVPMITVCFVIFSGCNSTPTGPEEPNTADAPTEMKESSAEIVNNSSLKLSFTFDGKSYKNDLSQPNQLSGIRTTGLNWLISFGGISPDKIKEVILQFKIENYQLEKKITNVKNCTINLMGFEDSEVSDAALFSTESIFLEITSVKKIKSESAMGTTLEKYSVNGSFNGEFKNITGTKIFKVENGTFENYILVDLKSE